VSKGGAKKEGRQLRRGGEERWRGVEKGEVGVKRGARVRNREKEATATCGKTSERIQSRVGGEEIK